MTENGNQPIEIDIEQLTYGQLRRVIQWQEGDSKLSTEEQLDLLDSIVVGGIDDLPISATDDILTAITEAVGDASNPEATTEIKGHGQVSGN